MKIFSKEKYIENRGLAKYKENKMWVDECDLKEVTDDGEIIGTDYSAMDKWCVCTDEYENIEED